MKKTALKTGWRVTQRDGDVLTVLLGTDHGDVLVNPKKNSHSWEPIRSFNDDLTHEEYGRYDILKVEKPNHPYDIFYPYSFEPYVVIWERYT
jgi:hypothetical protein